MTWFWKAERVYKLYDTGSNITILLESLAKELDLLRTFCQAANHVRHFIGKLGNVKVQLHDGLELMVGGIR